MNSKHGFTLLETLTATSIFTLVMTCVYMLFISGENIWAAGDSKMRVQQSVRQSLQRIAFELQESGKDQNNSWKISINNNTGTNGSDILKFSVPICVCGINDIDSNGNVTNWGAPLNWGKANCNNNITINPNGQVTICHLPPGNPANEQTIDVATSSINAHLAHGDRLGACNSCSPSNYTNRQVQYRINNNNQLVRQVIDNANAVVNQVTISDDVIDLQAALDTANNIVTLTITSSRNYKQNAPISITQATNVFLRNGG